MIKKTKKLLEIAAIAVIIGFAMMGCGESENNPDISNSPNNTNTPNEPNPPKEPNLPKEPSLPALSGTVSISGTAMVGNTLTADTSSLGGSGTISYQWKRGTAVIGSNSSTYTLQTADIDKTITVTVTRAGYSGSVTSSPTAIVTLQMTEGLAYELIKGNTEYLVSLGTARALGEIVIPAVYNGLPVTAIAANGFSNCPNMTSIIIPTSVTDIGANALSGCTGLTSITIPFTGASLNGTANTHFGYLFGAASYTNQNSSIPSSLKTVIVTGGKSIGSDAFRGCSGLTSITIPNSVTSVGRDAFYDCSSLTSITIPFIGASLNGTADTHFGYIFGAASYTNNNSRIPSSLKTVIVTGVTSIGDYAFRGCGKLTSITIPNGVTSIGSGAFYDCVGLTNITIPNSVTSIGSSAFLNCRSLTSITIPNSVTSVGRDAFSYCSGLTSIVIPYGVTSISDGAFFSCSGLTSITIPNGVTSIGIQAFSYCSSLTSITIPNSVTSIGDYAFEDCIRLTTVFYNGNGSNWDSITIGTYNNDLTNATRYYVNQ